MFRPGQPAQILYVGVFVLVAGLMVGNRVVFDSGDLVVVNVLRRFRVPWTAVVVGSCSSGRFGTSVTYRSGPARMRTLTAAAVPTSPAGRWTGDRRPAELAQLVDRAAAAAQGLPA